tara:strand:+ start:28 stop:177 length:150 start_codon:yes stop_codon:yes gene_type:complete
VPLKLISGTSDLQWLSFRRDFRSKAFSEKIGSEKENFPVLVDHGALKQC